MLRLFTAIEIPETLRTRLTFLQSGVPGARWTPVENLHLTLRFIGEVDEPTAVDIDAALSVLREDAFQLTLRGVGEFGGRDPHAIWAGVAANPALTHLVAKIERALQRIGLPAETRKYAPHVTLARLRDTPVAKVLEFLSTHGLFDSGPFDVRSFGLYSSFQTPRGSLYREERRYPLELTD
ncbi:MAG: RNA 2',3'-cyclic phosphodiesterase [Alphaproteobacteria bacterium]|nr:RNA 2',3'-cyclic phosphodiesterase [Alphaproteobacteria bacterium]